MRTISLLMLVAGLNMVSASCTIFSRNSSRHSPAEKNFTSATPVKTDSAEMFRSALRSRKNQAIKFAQQNGYSTEYVFLIDMEITSGKNRFFVYDLKNDGVELSGLVAHGNCNTHFLEQAKFSNMPNCGCSSEGKYKVGASYHGEFGKSYRLYGLDSTNSNALKRGIVLHGFDPVPDHEIYPEPLCNSFGCPMVNRSFLAKLSEIIDKSPKPILLWVYE